ncbi:ladderlectin-like [Danio aesculapii]|uniref:ladderlectin-like n=1 Tax=Danio aesculapii TaxID=1142201 RepID=UPI0024BFA901|nr:ladderlectin-like [Danio aesculapii]
MENDVLLSLVPSSTRCWIGGHDGEQDGQWLWSDGSSFGYTNWCSGEPSSGSEHCLEINWTSTVAGTMGLFDHNGLFVC